MPKFKAEDIAHILSCSGRKVKKMLPDGNCLFRSLSFCLHRSQDRHLEIRKILVQFIERNGNNYKHLLFGRTLSEHLESMMCGVLSLNFKLLQTTMRCVFIFSPRDSSKRGTIGIDTHPGTVHLQTTCHTSNLLTQDQYTLIPSLMLPHFRFRRRRGPNKKSKSERT